MELEHETKNDFKVNCAVGTPEFYFVGLENNRVLCFATYGHEVVQTVLTKRTPISMTILDNRLCIVGLKNHAYTSINYRNEFKQIGMTWNMGNDWSQVYTNAKNNGFYRVWQQENMTFASLEKAGTGSNPKSVEFQWQTDHVVNKDMHILGEIDDNHLLFYSFTDR